MHQGTALRGPQIRDALLALHMAGVGDHDVSRLIRRIGAEQATIAGMIARAAIHAGAGEDEAERAVVALAAGHTPETAHVSTSNMSDGLHALAVRRGQWEAQLHRRMQSGRVSHGAGTPGQPLLGLALEAKGHVTLLKTSPLELSDGDLGRLVARLDGELAALEGELVYAAVSRGMDPQVAEGLVAALNRHEICPPSLALHLDLVDDIRAVKTRLARARAVLAVRSEAA